ncbi:MAG: acetamidase/formamidase family protein [Pirellulaceae bacterium]|jgi:acetamidase/formamidase|nr:acetamidase/formamidase family protein [Pirellulaceae bacterium]
MQRVAAEPLVYEFSRHLAPRVTIQPGESLLVESEDALSGQLRTSEDRRDKTAVPKSNPVAGPILVEGAEPGDVLAITIQQIRPRDDQAATYTGHPGRLAEWLGSEQPSPARICPIRDGQVYWNDTTPIPFAPMLGCLGTAPEWGVASTQPAGAHGGNLDLVEVCPGAVVFLPVFCSGGYLYLGDAHAAMGHGELSGTGLEMAAETTITVDLLKEKQLAGPRIESDEEIMAVATGCPMERSVAAAYAQLILWMEEDFGWDRWHAYDLLTHVGKVSVGYYGIGTVAAKIQKQYLTG